MGYRESEFYGYINGKLLWFAHEGLPNAVTRNDCANCHAPDDDGCENCVASKAHLQIEKQIIDEGIKFMTDLARRWRKG